MSTARLDAKLRWTAPYSAVYPRLFLKTLAATPRCTRSVLTGTGLSIDDLRQHDAVINYRQFLAVVRNAIDASEIPSLALHAGALTTLGTHGPMGLAMHSAPDLRSVLTTITRFACTRGPFAVFSLQTDEYRSWIDVDIPQESGDSYINIVEFVMLCLERALHAVAPASLDHARLEFAFQAPAHAADYATHFSMPVRFGRARNRLVVDVNDLDIPLESANVEAHRNAVDECERQSQKLRRSPIERQIREVLSQHSGRLLSLEEAAQHLRLSTRTLQRRCTEAETSFNAIHDRWNCELAATHLRQRDIPQEALARLLGYADASGLRQAWRRWQAPPKLGRR